MRSELAALKGGLTLAPTQKDALGRGKEGAPASDYESKRFGFSPPESIEPLRRQALVDMAGAYGIPAPLVDERSSAAAYREAARVFRESTLPALGAILAEQVGEAIGQPDLALAFPKTPDIGILVSGGRESHGHGGSGRVRSPGDRWTVTATATVGRMRGALRRIGWRAACVSVASDRASNPTSKAVIGASNGTGWRGAESGPSASISRRACGAADASRPSRRCIARSIYAKNKCGGSSSDPQFVGPGRSKGKV